MGCAGPGIPRCSTLFVPKALKSVLFWIAAGAGSRRQRQCSGRATAPGFALPKGSSCGSKEMQISPGCAVPGAPGVQSLRRPRGSEGSGSAMGNHPRPWIECRADGRTNSTRISVSHNLLLYSLPRLTFSSHGADLLLEKATRNTGRVSAQQVVVCSGHHQGQYTGPQRIFFFSF